MTARAGESQAGKVGCALQGSLQPRALWPEGLVLGAMGTDGGLPSMVSMSQKLT